MRTITPKMNEKRIAEIPKVRWDTAQAWRTARRVIRTMLIEDRQASIFRGLLWINKLHASKESEQN